MFFRRLLTHRWKSITIKLTIVNLIGGEYVPVKLKISCIGIIVLAAIGLAASLPPIPQNAAYHVFADEDSTKSPFRKFLDKGNIL